MSLTAGRIDERAFEVIWGPSIRKSYWPLNKAVVGTLFGLSILTAMIRTTYRIQIHGRLLFDDFVLVFACVALTAATGLLYEFVPAVYRYEEIIHNPELNVLRIFGSVAELFAQIRQYERLGSALITLTWVTIFSVKICFLLFFLQLVDRQKKLMFIWKIVFAITMAVFCFCAFGTLISCPHLQSIICKLSSFYNTGFPRTPIAN